MILSKVASPQLSRGRDGRHPRIAEKTIDPAEAGIGLIEQLSAVLHLFQIRGTNRPSPPPAHIAPSTPPGRFFVPAADGTRAPSRADASAITRHTPLVPRR
jgi:hypothetical protein